MATALHDEHLASEDVHRRRWWILALLCTSLMIVIIGNTSLNVALPTLARELDASTSDLQWMVDAYSLVFAGMLLTAGALGDRFGRKGALQLGLVLFGTGALIATFADGAGQIIVGRAVMGFAGAFVMPSTLSILSNVFGNDERPKAIAIWAGVAGGGAALGPVASGFLLEHFFWGSVFLVNLPIIIGSLLIGRWLLPKSSNPTDAPLDPIGALLSIVGLSALVYAIIEGPDHGWRSAESAFWFGLAAVVIVAFLLWERSRRDPMLNLHFFEDRRFSVSSGGITLIFFAMFGTFFLTTQYFQLVLGYSPLGAGVRLLPMSIVMMALAPQTPKFVARFGANRVAGSGLLLVALGLVLYSFSGVSSAYLFVLVYFVFLAAGFSLVMSPMTTQLMSAVPRAKAGVGSAMNDTTRELGGALGVAVLGSLVTSRYTSSLASALEGVAAPVRAIANTGLSGAVGLADHPEQFPGLGLSPETAHGIKIAAQQAFVDGLGLAALVGAAVVALASVAVFRYLPSDRTNPEVVGEDGPEEEEAALVGAAPTSGATG